MRNGNLLKSRVSEICVKRICVNQGVGALENQFMAFSYYIHNWTLKSKHISYLQAMNVTYKQFVMKTKIIFVKTNLLKRVGCLGGLFGYNANFHT